ncbi:Gfo/Idh/MocA family protein [Devosia sp.]|uniref:Gfo/Idh/MocA family protein n=1 Tax=Devosia sp. TaxID=1871048 RepID=UPI0035B26C49
MRLLILGTGRMANSHAKAFAAIEGVEMVGAVDTDPAALAAFCDTYGIARRFASLEAALEWGAFDAVDNITPDSIHHATTLAALAAGKHVFCEKPLATDHGKAMQMVEAAEAAGLVNMVNLTYRNVAELHKAREIIAAGSIGEVKHIEASYLQHWLALRDFTDTASLAGTWLWRLSTGHGSNGTLGDIGIHILDFTSFATGQPIVAMNCRLQTFHKVPGDCIGDYVLDANDSFIISAEFGNGAIGVIHSSRWASGHSNDQRLRVYGNKGGLELSHGHWGSLLRVCAGEDVATSTWREVRADPVPTNYQRFAEAVRTGIQSEPGFRHAAGLQKVLDLALVADRDRREHQV